jgi:hypothetical protein
MVTRSPAYQPRVRAVVKAALFTGAVLYSWAAGGLGQNTLPATVAIVLPGVAGLWLARRRPPPDQPPAARVNSGAALTWALWALAFLLWEAAAFFFQESPTVANPDHPTLSALMEPILAPQPVRALGYLAWLLGGWRLLRR